MSTLRSKPQRLSTPSLLVLALLTLVWLTACAAPPPTRQPTRARTRAPVSFQSTKVARPVPTATPAPTRTRRPTRTPIPTVAHTPTRPNTPLKRSALTPTSAAAQASSSSSAAPVPVELTPPPPTVEPTIASQPQSVDLGNVQCEPTGPSDYGILHAGGWEGRAPESHPDLNLGVRGYARVDAFRGLVDYDGETDINAPQLWGLFADRRTPTIVNTYQVYDWNWNGDVRGDLVTDFEVTMIGVAVAQGETIYTPDFGLELGEGYVALVLYASPGRITIKYTGEDNVVDGYTLHLEGLCVNSTLLALYNDRHSAGRGALPALRPGQPLGYTPQAELGVAIRDRGAFLDPRSRKDWWQGR